MNAHNNNSPAYALNLLDFYNITKYFLYYPLTPKKIAQIGVPCRARTMLPHLTFRSWYYTKH
jgi:hypothetical protein